MTPAIEVTHSCNVPERTGYQVIYAVWEIADTANSFYQAIDVDFGGTGDDAENSSLWTTQLTGQLSGKIFMLVIKSLPISLMPAERFIRCKRN